MSHPDRADEDQQLLQSLGYTQELARSMKGFQNFAISFSIICILSGGINSLGQGIGSVGGAAIGIGWLVGCAISAIFALGMAQISSAFPTAGGLYHWGAILGGRGWGWLTAWLNLLGLPMGVDVCYTNHAEADSDDMDALLALLCAAGVNFIMGIPGSDDIMLNYQSTSFHDALVMRQLYQLRPAPEFEAWLQRMGVFPADSGTRLSPALASGLPPALAARVQRLGGREAA